MNTVDVPSGEVHLWQASLALSDSEIERLRSLLTAEEIQRADRFRVETARRRFVAARASLRILLGRVSGTPPGEVVFAFGSRGKPTLQDGGPAFNASDSGDVVVIGLASKELGVDIEVNRSLWRWQRLAHRICTEREFEQLEETPESRRPLELLRLWTCKEAALKAIGTGLSGGLRNVEVDLPAHERLQLRRLLDDLDGWTLLKGDLGQEIVCSVVVKGTGWRIVEHRLEI